MGFDHCSLGKTDDTHPESTVVGVCARFDQYVQVLTEGGTAYK